MNTKNEQNWQDNEALKRYQLIAPLLDESLDIAKKSVLRQQLAEQNDLSERTLYRYESAFADSGFGGLKPADKSQQISKQLPANFDELLEEAILLKREVPTRSVNQIILILELEHRVPPNVLKRSTLQRHLYKEGFGKKQLKKYNQARESSSKRFCKPHRMMLAQADIKYGLKLPIGPKGAMVQTYIVAIIDDHSKVILGSGVYDNQEAYIVEDAYRKAILQFGAFTATYVDNGKQFISKELIDALSRLGIRHLRAKPYACQSKGKIEVYNRLINSYLAECKAQKVRTLTEARYYWELFVEEYYHNKTHEGIEEYYVSLGSSIPSEGITPLQEFNRDSRPLKFLDAKLVGEAFLHHEKREVDKGACISFDGRKYEVSPSLIGSTVEISYDPMKKDTLTVLYPGLAPFTTKPLKIGEFCDKTPELPECMLPKEPECSRFLKGLESRSKQRVQKNADAISFAFYRKEDDSDV